MGAMRRNCCGTQHGLGPAVVAAAVALERRAAAAAAVGWARPASSDEEARDF